MDPIFFATPAEFRQWLHANHETETELYVGFYKKSSGLSSLTWQEAVEQALCFGWIDGIRRTIDSVSYTNRFTPRKRNSHWSLINVQSVERLTAAGQMYPAGLAAFEARKTANTGNASFEQGNVALSPEDEALIAANPAAWENWQAFPPGYRKQATWWVTSARLAATRSRRLQQLIEDASRGERIAPLRRIRRTT